MSLNVRTLVLRESTEIIASPEAVRAAFDDLESWPKWNSVCRDAAWMSGEPWAIGSGFHMTLRMARRPIGFSVFVTEFGQDAVTWESTVLSITGTRRFTFAEQSRRFQNTRYGSKDFSQPLPSRAHLLSPAHHSGYVTGAGWHPSSNRPN